MRVLVVERNRANRAALTASVLSANPSAQIETAATYLSALQKLKSNRYAMIFVAETLDGNRTGHQLVADAAPTGAVYILEDRAPAELSPEKQEITAIGRDQISTVFSAFSADQGEEDSLVSGHGNLVIHQPKKWVKLAVNVLMVIIGAVTSAITIAIDMTSSDIKLQDTVAANTAKIAKWEPVIDNLPAVIQQIKSDQETLRQGQSNIKDAQEQIKSAQQQMLVSQAGLVSMISEWKTSNEKRLDSLELKIDRKGK